MIDRTALLATLRPLVVELEDSIRSRVLETPEVAEHLDHEHSRAVAARRTAMSLEEWRDGEITQAAVAWVLGCVFVRFLEDNGLIDQALISGPGGRRAAALGHREEHFRAHPSHSDREYLEACFREVAKYPAVAPLYDERHNPLWRLGPTADGARTLRETFTAIEPASGALVHDFADAALDTRFLGDLYQDLSEAAKKRYALLQTPEFVERFILDRTLGPAIDEFGLEEVRLIDPTCGSGHFLIGAFEHLSALWQEREPATAVTVRAQRCLDHIAGVDLNPYATAIARFRLTIAALRACAIERLAEAPALRLHLATGDSLLHGPLPDDGATMLFDANRLKKNVAHVYESEDAAELKDILGRGYHAVVGNPPYIAVRDPALRDAYRSRYASCHGKYVMTVPFMERFFELAQIRTDNGARLAGFVGKITGNSFMRREFGAPLVEKFLPSVDVQTVIDASGAYIPGHGTPTILLFGRSRAPVATTLRVVDGIRGEPRQPEDPALGLVWSAIEAMVDRLGHRDRFVRCSPIERAELFVHPMTLGVGRGLRTRIEGAARRISSVSESVGITSFTLEDELFLAPETYMTRKGIELHRPIIEGDGVRDWVANAPHSAVFPYDDELVPVFPDPHAAWWRHLWRARTNLSRNLMFGGKTKVESGLAWYEFGRLTANKLRTPLAITWGEVATHNHFVFASGRSVFNRTAPVIKVRETPNVRADLFKQTAPIIKLADESTEEQHLALLGVLNSSVACFWLKQVCQPKGSSGMGRGIYDEAWESFSAFNATNVRELPLPPARSPTLARALHRLAAERADLLKGLALATGDASLSAYLASLRDRDATLTARMVSLQEELDWEVMANFGLVPKDQVVLGEDAPPIALGQRAFEIVLARQVESGETETSWFERHASTALTELPNDWPPEYSTVVKDRIALIESDPDIGLIERPEHKRRWSRAPWTASQRDALVAFVLDELEHTRLWDSLRLHSTNELTDELRRVPTVVEALELLADRKDADFAGTVRRLVVEESVPHVAAQRLTEKGLRKAEIWESVWEMQRAEDHGEEVGTISVPPYYAQADFRSATSWKQRGKLDVPKERFVLIPNAERGADASPVVGWAGWNERDLARALAARITELRQEHAADAERLVPLLAGVLELLPWIHQWHPDSDALFGGPPGAFFEGWLDGELASLGVTRETLSAWRPPTPTRGRKATASTT
jgi:hypothetical protein